MIDVNKMYKCGYGVSMKEDGSYVAMVLMESFDTEKDALFAANGLFEKIDGTMVNFEKDRTIQ